VNNEAESKEAQELFYQLGFTWGGVFGQCVKTLKFPCVVFNSSKFLKVDHVVRPKDISSYQELTLPQLRDLVVLHRNDPKDANVQQDGDVTCLYDLYLTEGKELYFYHCGKGKWIISNLNHDEDYYRILKPIQKQQPEKDLISGADALRALADGQLVQYSFDDDKYWQADIANLKITDFGSGHFQFRLKPRTIKLELEIPAPFEPKVGEIYYFITICNSEGFDFTEFEDSDGDELLMQLGAYRNASDARKAVAALRGGIKG